MKTPTEFQIGRLAHAVIPKVPPKNVAASKPPSPSAPLGDPKQVLSTLIKELESKLVKLDALIAQRESAKHSGIAPRMQAKRERAGKENTKPKTVAEQAQMHRALRHASRKDGSGGSKDKQQNSSSKTLSLEELKVLATRVRGQIVVAKQKLAAL